MFTVRFVRRDKVYKSLSVVQYQVEQHPGFMSIGMFRTADDATYCHERVGPEEEFEIAYITNLNGRTIDVVRQKEI